MWHLLSLLTTLSLRSIFCKMVEVRNTCLRSVWLGDASVSNMFTKQAWVSKSNARIHIKKHPNIVAHTCNAMPASCWAARTASWIKELQAYEWSCLKTKLDAWGTSAKVSSDLHTRVHIHRHVCTNRLVETHVQPSLWAYPVILSTRHWPCTAWSTGLEQRWIVSCSDVSPGRTLRQVHWVL